MKKAISLIVLVITIIIMIILASAVVIALSNNGIITRSNEASFKQNIKTFMEEFEIYKATYIGIDKQQLVDLNVNSNNINSVITSIPSNLSYKDKLMVRSGNLIYNMDNKNATDVQRAKWACEMGMTVEGINECNDIEYTETQQTAYTKVANTYYNTPDITGFNPETTYFVTYNNDGSAIIGNNLTKSPPQDWFDYENKKWANIVVIKHNEDGMADSYAYFVWIPRYVYRINGTNKTIDVKFVNRENVYTASDGTNTTYSDIVPSYDEAGNQTNYIVASAFTLDMSDEAKENVELAGYWMSKYEVSGANINSISTVRGTNSIKVTGINATGISKYEYYINDELKTTTSSSTYTFDNLDKDTTYNIRVDGKLSNDDKVATIEVPVTTLGDNTDGISGYTGEAYGDHIKVFSTSINAIAQQNPEKIYEFYLDDVLIESKSTGDYVFENLAEANVYRVTVKIRDSGTYYGSYTRTFTTPKTPVYGEANAPEMTGFNLDRTYYLTYDASGNETRVLVRDNFAPTDWYDYSQKKWANIVVSDPDTGAEAYYVWIPKYEYRIFGTESPVASDKIINIAFIPTNKIVPTEGYSINSAYTLDMSDDGGTVEYIPGYWISKYEVSKMEL